MTTYSVQRSLRGACAAVLLVAAVCFADSTTTSGNPETNASDRNFDTNQPNSAPGGMQKATDAANRGMNKVDQGVHKGIHGTKKGSKKAAKKTNEAMDDLSTPAKKP